MRESIRKVPDEILKIVDPNLISNYIFNGFETSEEHPVLHVTASEQILNCCIFIYSL